MNKKNGGRILGGRSNPVLPRQMQEALEDMGVIDRPTDAKTGERSEGSAATKSTQTIDLKRGVVSNVVSVPLPASPFLDGRKRATLTVDVDFKPNASDSRRIDVKFQSCRFVLPAPFGRKIDATLPLGPIGPTGWLRTTYIDDSARITRGHKGSVFILKRAGGTKIKG